MAVARAPEAARGLGGEPAGPAGAGEAPALAPPQAGPGQRGSQARAGGCKLAQRDVVQQQQDPLQQWQRQVLQRRALHGRRQCQTARVCRPEPLEQAQHCQHLRARLLAAVQCPEHPARAPWPPQGRITRRWSRYSTTSAVKASTRQRMRWWDTAQITCLVGTCLCCRCEGTPTISTGCALCYLLHPPTRTLCWACRCGRSRTGCPTLTPRGAQCAPARTAARGRRSRRRASPTPGRTSYLRPRQGSSQAWPGAQGSARPELPARYKSGSAQVSLQHCS